MEKMLNVSDVILAVRLEELLQLYNDNVLSKILGEDPNIKEYE